MSATERKNGSRVLDAARQVGYRRGSMFRGMFTVGEVMAQSGMSRPTVTKYLKICEEHGLVKSTILDKHLKVFRFMADGKEI